MYRDFYMKLKILYVKCSRKDNHPGASKATLYQKNYNFISWLRPRCVFYG